MIKYIVKRLLLALIILLGVSLIIYALVMMMPVDYIETKYAEQLKSGAMDHSDIIKIKKELGVYMPDAFLTVEVGEGSNFNGYSFDRDVQAVNYDRMYRGDDDPTNFYSGNYYTSDLKYRLVLGKTDDPDSFTIYELTVDEDGKEVYTTRETGDFKVIDALPYEDITFSIGATRVACKITYRVAKGGEKARTVMAGYFQWLGNMFKGNFGTSFLFNGMPVTKVISDHMWISFVISLIALVLQFAIAIPMGITSATHQYSARDYAVTVITMIGISFPSFFFAALLVKLFATTLGWFPVTGLVSGGSSATGFVRLADMAWHLVLPMIVLVVLSIGGLMRYTRTNMLEVLNSDYIRTARAKGLSEKKVIYVHAFRNTLIPLMTLLAGILPSLFGGAMITEQVFAIDGIGGIAYKALRQGDLPLIMGYNMFLAVLTVIGTLLSDIMYAVVDPRVKLTK